MPGFFFSRVLLSGAPKISGTQTTSAVLHEAIAAYSDSSWLRPCADSGAGAAVSQATAAWLLRRVAGEGHIGRRVNNDADTAVLLHAGVAVVDELAVAPCKTIGAAHMGLKKSLMKQNLAARSEMQ